MRLIMIKSNPNNPTPADIAAQITELEVAYIDFKGDHQKGIIEVNQSVSKDVREFFLRAQAMSFPFEKVVRSSDAPYLWDDIRLLAANVSSGFNYRLIKDSDRPSLHSLGLAIDTNTRLNPYVRYNAGEVAFTNPEGAVYDSTLPGVFTTNHPLVVFMKERGWEWGGDWTKESGRIDYQHFQKSI